MKTRLLLLCICALVLAGVGWSVYEYSSGKAEEAAQEQERLAQADRDEPVTTEDEQPQSVVAVTKLIVEKSEHKPNDQQNYSNPFSLRVEISYEVHGRAVLKEPLALQLDVEYPDEYAEVIGSRTGSGNSLYLMEGSRAEGSDVFYEGVIDADAAINGVDRLLLSRKQFKITVWVDGGLHDTQLVYNTPVDRGGLIAKAAYENEPEAMKSYTKLFHQAMPKAELVGKILADMDGDGEEELLVIYRDTTYNTSSNICVMREGQANGINLVPGSNQFVFAEGAASLHILEDPKRASIKLKNKQTERIVYYELTIDPSVRSGQDAIQIQKIEE